MKNALCSLLAMAVVMSSVPVAAAEKVPVVPISSAAPLQAAIDTAGSRVTPIVVRPAASSTASVPTALPRSGSRRIRKQGGGGMGMAIGLIGTLAGVAGTVYMVKQMKKNTDDVDK